MIGVCILVTKLEELELMQIALHKKEEAGEGAVGGAMTPKLINGFWPQSVLC